jgi:hypothetical protein
VITFNVHSKARHFGRMVVVAVVVVVVAVAVVVDNGVDVLNVLEFILEPLEFFS